MLSVLAKEKGKRKKDLLGRSEGQQGTSSVARRPSELSFALLLDTSCVVMVQLMGSL